ncbi:hypothetical protein X759_27345 [Mesorhizobium sp. LSHC420B00]|nr:hypothetical protein X759_27345 [Mesorhizobium sp. LSHC420B00]
MIGWPTRSPGSHAFGRSALLDANDHSLAVDVRGLELHRFRDAQAGGIASGQNGVVFDVEEATEEPLNFLATEDDRQPLRLLGKREDLFRRPVPFERCIVEKAHRRNGGVNRAGRQFLFVGQINLIGPSILWPEQVRRLAEVAGEQRLVLQIRQLGVERELAHLHVCDPHSDRPMCLSPTCRPRGNALR